MKLGLVEKQVKDLELEHAKTRGGVNMVYTRQMRDRRYLVGLVVVVVVKTIADWWMR